MADEPNGVQTLSPSHLPAESESASASTHPSSAMQNGAGAPVGPEGPDNGGPRAAPHPPRHPRPTSHPNTQPPHHAVING